MERVVQGQPANAAAVPAVLQILRANPRCSTPPATLSLLLLVLERQASPLDVSSSVGSMSRPFNQKSLVAARPLRTIHVH